MSYNCKSSGLKLRNVELSHDAKETVMTASLIRTIAP